MSHHSELKALRTEVAELREELAKVRLEVVSLKRGLLEKGSGESDSSFSVISDLPFAGLRAPSSAAAAEVAKSSWCERSSASDPCESSSQPISWEKRLEICKEIGKFLARAVRTEHRGASGRDKIPLASRFWLVARDFQGQQFSPVRVFSRWGAAKDLVKKGSDGGDSVFVGLPSQREIEAVITASGLRWDGKIEG